MIALKLRALPNIGGFEREEQHVTIEKRTIANRENGLRVGRYIAVTVALLLLLDPVQVAWAETSPTAYCRQIETDDTLRSVPPSLVAVVVKLFRLEPMPVEQVRRPTYFRCSNHHVLVCNVGANLPCGKADTRGNLPPVDACLVRGSCWIA